eukprot:gene25680-34253_t
MLIYVVSIVLLSISTYSSFQVGINSFRRSHILKCAPDSSAKPPTTPTSEIKLRLANDMKEAMRSKQKERLAAIRAIQTAIKQKEVDERVIVDEDAAILIMSKLVKQRKESIKSYLDGGRSDLADAETVECNVIQSYMPTQLSQEEIAAVITESIRIINATTIKDMGKVMADIRPKLSGKADLSQVGEIIKKLLSPPK